MPDNGGHAFHLPGYNYCGPGTHDFSKKPANKLDAICRIHDLGYAELLKKHSRYDVYTHFNSADQRLLDSDFSGTDPIDRGIVEGTFHTKRVLAPALDETNDGGVPTMKLRKYNGQVGCGLGVLNVADDQIYKAPTNGGIGAVSGHSPIVPIPNIPDGPPRKKPKIDNATGGLSTGEKIAIGIGIGVGLLTGGEAIAIGEGVALLAAGVEEVEMGLISSAAANGFAEAAPGMLYY